MVLGFWNPEFTVCPFRARKWPFQAPKTQRFKVKMANFEAKKTIKEGKKTPKGQMVPISRVYEGTPPGGGWGGQGRGPREGSSGCKGGREWETFERAVGAGPTSGGCRNIFCEHSLRAQGLKKINLA